ncbi:MAG: NAD(P)-dependent oxidoreductase [Nitrospirae bacterium]|nr:NAD(P)-dependent oxidoreductase [Nitrospirota bacterium]
MKALVTGATGFIGSHLCEELARRGHQVTCLVRENSNLKWIESIDLKIITGDCENIESLHSAVKGVDYIFHLAGLTKACSDDEFFCVNAMGTKNLITATLENNPKLRRFVYISSLAAVGPSQNGSPVKEDTAPKPVSSYGKSKLEGEKAVLGYKKKIPVTIIRPSAVYGPRDRDLFIFFRMLKKGIFPYWGKCYYSLVYVDDLVQGIILAAENRKAEGEIYFLSDSKFYTNDEIVNAISSAFGIKAVRLRIPKFIMPYFAYIGEKIDRKGIINRDKINELTYSHWICDITKAREELGFIPKVRIKEGMKWTVDWYRIHRWL